MHCHLLIPGLIPPRPILEELGPSFRLPALETLLARGERHVEPAIDISEWLCRIFNIAKQQDWPVAPVTLRADGIEPGQYYWLRADPVHLRVSRDRLILADGRTFALSAAEAEAFITSLNRHFAHDGWHFLAPVPDRWYLRLEQAPALETCPLTHAAGGYVDMHLPNGNDARYWRAAMNEIQMLFHEHPINLAREGRGELPVNSIWPWGGGTWKEKPHSYFSHICANDALTCAFAMASGIACLPLPANAGDWLARLPQTSASLAVLDSMDAHAHFGATTSWAEAAHELERYWFAPLKHALAEGRIKKITLHAPGAHGALEIPVGRRHLWRIWRRRNLLSALV